MRLTTEQIEARICMYQEAVDHMEMDIYHDSIEREQALFIRNQIIRLRDKFIEKHQSANV
jgi:hypothetical protein